VFLLSSALGRQGTLRLRGAVRLRRPFRPLRTSCRCVRLRLSAAPLFDRRARGIASHSARLSQARQLVRRSLVIWPMTQWRRRQLARIEPRRLGLALPTLLHRLLLSRSLGGPADRCGVGSAAAVSQQLWRHRLLRCDRNRSSCPRHPPGRRHAAVISHAANPLGRCKMFRAPGHSAAHIDLLIQVESPIVIL
jgi:hypothetical protein